MSYAFGLVKSYIHKSVSIFRFNPVLSEPAVPSSQKPIGKGRFSGRGAIIYALEPRYLFDGAVLATAAASTPHSDIPITAARLGADPLLTALANHIIASDPTAGVTGPTQVRVPVPSLDSGKKEVVFVDTNVDNFQAIVASIKSGIEVELIDGGEPGLAQMAIWAESHKNYDAIHVISHGSDATLFVGTDVVSNNSLNNTVYKLELAEIGSAINTSGELFLYGCDVAKGGDGQSFIENIAHDTESVVAASVDLTGSAHSGANWALEASTGKTISTLPFDSGIYSYEYTLSAQDIMTNIISGTPVITGTSAVIMQGGYTANWTNSANYDLSTTNFHKSTSYATPAGNWEFKLTNSATFDLNSISFNSAAKANTGNGYGAATINMEFIGYNAAGAQLYDTGSVSVTLPNYNAADTTYSFTGWSGVTDVLVKSLGGVATRAAQGAGIITHINVDNVTIPSSNAAPTITGSSPSAGADNATATPFTSATVGDTDSGDTVKLHITYTAANGTLSGTGLTGSAGDYWLESSRVSPGTLTSELDALVFTPTANQVAPGSTVTTTFTLTANDGTADSTANTASVLTVTSINDAPAGGDKSVTGTEDTTYSFQSSDFTFSDPDFGSAFGGIKLTSAGATAGTLWWDANHDGINNDSALTTNSTISAAEIAGGYLKFSPAADANGTAYATFTFKVTDGSVYSSSAYTETINVTAVNDAPVLTAGGTNTYTEAGGGGQGAAVTAHGTAITVSDVDNTTEKSATVSISAYYSTGDVLAFTNDGSTMGNIDGSYDGSGTLTLTSAGSTASKAQWEAALNAVTYYSTSHNPDANGAKTSRTLTWAIDDGQASNHASAGVTSTLNISAVNDAPVLANVSGIASNIWYQGGGAVVLKSNAAVSDAELDALNSGSGNYAGASLVIARNGGASVNDVLSLVTGGGLTASGSTLTSGGNVIATLTNDSAGTYTVTFANNGTIPTTALVTKVLDDIAYSNSSPPTADGAQTVQLNWTFHDGNSGSQGSGGDKTGTGSTTVTLNRTPTVANAEGNQTASVGTAFSYQIPANTFHDADSDSLTYTVQQVDSNGANARALPAWLSFSTNTLSGTPAIGDVGTIYVKVTASDGHSSVSDAVISIATTALPTISSATYDPSTGALVLTGSNLSTDTVDASRITITGEGGNTFSLSGHTTASTATASSGTVTFTINPGDRATLAAVLDKNGTTAAVTGNFTLSATGNWDTTYTGEQDQSTKTITVTASGTPSVSVGGTASYTERASAATVESGLTITDAQSTMLTGATVTISANAASGDTLQFTDQNGITGSWNGTTLTLSGTASVANYQTALDSVTFVNSSNHNPTAGSATRTIAWAVTDAYAKSSSVQNTTLTITPINDTPVVTAPATITLTDTAAADPFGNTTGTISASDAENNALTYGIDTGTTGGSHVVGGVTYDISKVGTYGTLYVVSTGADRGKYLFEPNNTSINALAAAASVSDNFTVTASDGNTAGSNTLTVNVTGANDTPINTLAPSASGTYAVGQTLTAAAGTWTDAEGTALTYSYQWYRADNGSGLNSAPIGSATDSTYTLTTSDAHKFVRLVVSASDGSASPTANTAWTQVTNTAPSLTAPGTVVTYVDTAAPDTFNATTGTLAASDADGDSKTFGISSPTSSNANHTVNSVTYDISKVGSYGTLYVKSTTGEYIYEPSASAINARSTNTTDTFTVTVSDGHAGSDSQTLTVGITATNDAPVMSTTARTLTTIAEDVTSGANAGTTVATILGSAGTATDAESNTLGIAITAVDNTNGTWYYNHASGGWTAISGVTASTALLLADTDLVRYVPNADYNGSATGGITFKAWDQTTGTAGTTAGNDTTAGSGIGVGAQFSSNSASAAITVTAVNDAPVLSDTVVTMANEAQNAAVPTGAVGTLVSSIVAIGTNVSDVDANPVTGIAITALDTTTDAAGTWYKGINDGSNNFTWTAIGSVGDNNALLLRPSDRVFFKPSGTIAGTAATAFTFRAWDQTSGSQGIKVDTSGANHGGITAFSTATDIAALTITPTAPTGTPDLASGSDSGSDHTDNITNTSTADFSGTGTNANTIVRLYSGATLLATTTSDGTGAYTFSGVDVSGLSGAVSLTVRQVAGGVESADSSALSVNFDRTAPTVSGVTSSTTNGAYKAGDSVSIQVNFSEAVTVTGTPQLTLNSATGGRVVNYASGSGSSTLTFTYTVQAGDTASDLDFSATTALSAGTSIKDAAGNDATRTMPTPGAANSLGANKNIVIDTTAPTVTTVTRSDMIVPSGASGTFTVTYADTSGSGIDGNTIAAGNVSVTAPGSVSLAVTGASWNAGTNTATYTFTAPGGSWDIGDVGSYSISLNGNSVKDLAGNAMAAASGAKSFTVIYGPTITASNISVSGATGLSSTYKIGDTVTASWNNTSGGDNNGGVTGVTFNFSQFGGGTAVAATNSGGTWSASYIIAASTIDANNRNVTVSATDVNGTTSLAGTNNVLVDNQAPTVTAGKMSFSGASGTGGTFKIGDTVTATWDNSLWGDNNSDTLSSVKFDLSQFGGSTAVTATNSGGSWRATYTVTSGSIDASGLTTTVTVIDNAGNSTTKTSSATATLDAVAPTVTAGKITLSGASGLGGAFKIGDTVTASWNNSSRGDNNSHAIGAVTFDLSPFGGGSAVVGQEDGGVWKASYTITAANIDAVNRNVVVTATDTVGNATVTTGTNNATVDSIAPNLTSGGISLSGATGADGSIFKIGDVVTATWNATSSGDNEADTMASVKVDFSQFGGGTAVSASNSNGVWTAKYTLATGSLDTSGKYNVTVTATDNAGNVKTITGTDNARVDNQRPDAPDKPNLSSDSDSGLSNSDGITKNTTPTFSGSAEPRSTVTIYDTDGRTVLGTTTANASGDWRFTVPNDLSAGSHTIRVTATDQAGNVSKLSTGTTVVIVTRAPTISDPGLKASPGADSGTNVGTVSANDPGGQALQYQLIDDYGGHFAIDQTTGKVTIANPIDADTTAKSFQITVRVTDAAGLYTDKVLTIQKGTYVAPKTTTATTTPVVTQVPVTTTQTTTTTTTTAPLAFSSSSASSGSPNTPGAGTSTPAIGVGSVGSTDTGAGNSGARLITTGNMNGGAVETSAGNSGSRLITTSSMNNASTGSSISNASSVASNTGGGTTNVAATFSESLGGSFGSSATGFSAGAGGGFTSNPTSSSSSSSNSGAGGFSRSTTSGTTSGTTSSGTGGSPSTGGLTQQNTPSREGQQQTTTTTTRTQQGQGERTQQGQQGQTRGQQGQGQGQTNERGQQGQGENGDQGQQQPSERGPQGQGNGQGNGQGGLQPHAYLFGPASRPFSAQLADAAGKFDRDAAAFAKVLMSLPNRNAA